MEDNINKNELEELNKVKEELLIEDNIEEVNDNSEEIENLKNEIKLLKEDKFNKVLNKFSKEDKVYIEENLKEFKSPLNIDQKIEFISMIDKIKKQIVPNTKTSSIIEIKKDNNNVEVSEGIKKFENLFKTIN